MVLLGDPAIVQLGLDFLERVRRSRPRDTRIAIELADKSGNFAGRLELTIGEGGRITSSGAWDDLRESLGAGVVVGYGATRNLSSRQSDANDSQSAGLRQLRTLFEPLAQLASADVLLARHDPPSEILPLRSSLCSPGW